MPFQDLDMGRTMKSTRLTCDICHYYFTQLGDDGFSWQCCRCSNVEQMSGGWTNLYLHFKSCVGAD